MNVPLLGKIPLDPLIGKACDEGINPFLDETSEKLRNNSAINVYSNIASALKTSLSAMEINWIIDILKYLPIHVIMCGSGLIVVHSIKKFWHSTPQIFESNC